jgi:hypothetical protein
LVFLCQEKYGNPGQNHICTYVCSNKPSLSLHFKRKGSVVTRQTVGFGVTSQFFLHALNELISIALRSWKGTPRLGRPHWAIFRRHIGRFFADILGDFSPTYWTIFYFGRFSITEVGQI